MEKTQYYYKSDEKKVFLSKHTLTYSYFLGGYRDVNQIGMLTTIYIENNVTTLGPVFKNGEIVYRPEFAGKEVHNTTFLK